LTKNNNFIVGKSISRQDAIKPSSAGGA